MKGKEVQKGTLKKVLRRIRSYWMFLALSVLLAAVTVAATLYIPILTGRAVDLVIGRGEVDFSGIFRILLQIGVFIGIAALSQWGMNLSNNRVAYRVVRDCLLYTSRENREIELAFDEDRIVLSRRLSGREFAEKKLALGHRVSCLRYYDGSRLCTILYADFTDETLIAENCVNDPVKTAFGNQPLPSWAEFQAFLRERCIPEERDGLREYLETLGLEEYDPLRLIRCV